jgi:hypothetical protein
MALWQSRLVIHPVGGLKANRSECALFRVLQPKTTEQTSCKKRQGPYSTHPVFTFVLKCSFFTSIVVLGAPVHCVDPRLALGPLLSKGTATLCCQIGLLVHFPLFPAAHHPQR